MVAYNFQKEFSSDVETGKKRQTIRAHRKDGRHAKPGDKLQLYTGMRTKSCRKLVDPDPTCTSTEEITIAQDGISYSDGGVSMTPEVVAKRDGFATFEAMAEFFRKTHGLPFTGVLIRW